MCPPPVVDICKLDEGMKMLAGPGANPAVAKSAALSAVDTSNMPTITSVVFDGFLSDCTVCFSSHRWKSQSHRFVMHTCLSRDSMSALRSETLRSQSSHKPLEVLFWNCTELGHNTSQVIIGSYPHGDGTFDKANDFQSVVVDGAWTMGLATAKLHAGQVAYIVPAAKGEWLSLASCAPVTLADVMNW
jgi:hypothetical protein